MHIKAQGCKEVSLYQTTTNYLVRRNDLVRNLQHMKLMLLCAKIKNFGSENKEILA